MAASICRSYFRAYSKFRYILPSSTHSLLQTHRLPSGIHVNVRYVSRTILTEEQQRKNRRKVVKFLFKFLLLFIAMGYGIEFVYNLNINPLEWEPRRERKRRKLREEAERKKREEATSAERSSLEEDQDKRKKESYSLLPKVKAADIVDGFEGKGYVPPRSHQFNFIADAVDIAAPSVVYIEIKGRHPFTGQIVTVSNGSGFITDSDGLIITNAHVVATKFRNQTVEVKLHDGRTFAGEVIAADTESDLAAVHINTDKLQPLRLGKSSTLRPGEWVIAIGSPFSLSNTITSGIVSSLNREIKGHGCQGLEYIQTDAPINSGNSGGPLVNLNGEAIGINTLKLTAGISFAIPIDYAKDFLDKVRNMRKTNQGSSWQFFGKKPSSPVDLGASVKKGYLGIVMLTLTPPILSNLRQMVPNMNRVTHGVLVYRINVGSPAEVAGMRVGDVITHINGQPIRKADDVFGFIKTNQEATIKVIRETKEVEIKVKPE